jgi:hypothetical protein
MSAVDPVSVLPSRRDALDQLDALRERLAEFLDQPTSEGLRDLTNAVQTFVRFEAEEVLDAAVLADLPIERVDALAVGHDELSARANLLSWAVPGSAEAQTGAHRLRHEVLAQIDRYQALRLPRGALIAGT